MIMTESNESYDYALMFKALGDPTRLRIFDFLRAQRCLVAVGEAGDVRPVSARSIEGPTVGEVCCHVMPGAQQINSTISHHLKELRLAGLITVERRGKNMICGVNRRAVAALAAYLDKTGLGETDGAEPNECC